MDVITRLICLLSSMFQVSHSSFCLKKKKKKKDTEKVKLKQVWKIYIIQFVTLWVYLCWWVIYLEDVQTDKEKQPKQLCKFSKVS